MAKKVQYTTNTPSSSTDYLAADNTWKPMTGGGGGVPTTRTLTINGTAQDLSADRTWNVGDMLISVYDTDVDGVVDSAERIQIVVRNSTGSTLTKGQIVYLSGATGNRPNALLAKADAEATSSKTIGMVIADIPNNSDGSISVNGTLHDLNTSAFTAGDMLWLSATTAGGMVANTPPAEPNHAVFIGFVARSHPTQGRVVLAIQNGYELDELHGVQITSVANGQVLTYNSTSSLWENQSIPATSSASQFFIVGAATGLNAGLTRYGNIAGSTAESQVRLPLASACTISHLYVRTTATMNALASLSVTLFKNGSSTALTLTIAGGSVAATYSNTANSVSFAAGDGWTLGFVNAGTLTSAATSGQSVKITI
jgi:hypothetical protein